MQTLLNLLGITVTWGIWIWLATRRFEPLADLVIAVGGALAVIPIVFLGRLALDRQPDFRRAEKITIIVHYLIAVFLGSAIGMATRFAAEISFWPLQIPPWLGLGLMILAALVFILSVFNLVLKGLGAPLAFAFTRLVVTDWIYAWTRNPIVLSALALLVGLGFWLQSGLFLIWLLAVVSPVVLVFLKYYEERELEIRFGQEYLEYKEKTPRFFPRKP